MVPNTTMPKHLKEQVDRELERGEKIKWIGLPTPRFFTAASLSSFLFAIPWTTFALFWTFGASGFKLPDFRRGFSFFPLLFGLPFVLIGLGLLSSPLLAYRKSLRTVYVVTDQRAIIFNGGWSTTIYSYPPDKLQNIYRKENRNGTSDLIVAHRAWRDSDGDSRTEKIGFLGIRDAKQVEKMLKELAGRS